MSSYPIKNPDEFRATICTKMTNILGLKKPKHSINLERGIFNYAIKEATLQKIVKSWENPQFVQLYVDRLRTVYFNLKPALIKAIETGEVKSQDVAFMTHQEFAPEKWSELIDKKTKRDDSKFKEVQQSSTNLYACKKCGSRNCSYYELQIRSADEPATIFLTCIDCGKRWKI